MEIVATQKFLLLSPRKIRPVVDLVKKMSPTEAVERLPFVPQRGAEFLGKTIKQAIANARGKGVSETDLAFKEIQISEGPRLKRGRPVSRGQWHPVKRRMSHIRVVLQTTKTETKTETKQETVKKGKEDGTKD